MSNANDRDALSRDRLPDVRPPRAAGGYTRFESTRRVVQPTRRAVAPEEPAWWETDEPSQLPDASRWRPGSVINGLLPLMTRLALDRQRPSTTSPSGRRWDVSEPDQMSVVSRYSSTAEVPTWTENDLVRERSSWKDENAASRTGRRAKRNKRDRPDQQDRRGRASHDVR